jgi:hypothetical protein
MSRKELNVWRPCLLCEPIQHPQDIEAIGSRFLIESPRLLYSVVLFEEGLQEFPLLLFRRAEES